MTVSVDEAALVIDLVVDTSAVLERLCGSLQPALALALRGWL